MNAEKRRSVRLGVSYRADFRVTGSEAVELGEVTDLSAGGFLLASEREIEPGTGLSVTLRSPEAELVTAAWVLRCAAAADGHRYEVACAFD